MDEHTNISIMSGSHTPIYGNHIGASHWDWHDGGYFKVETEIELPLTRGLFYSGNPHI